eukprot:Em0001g1126a
MDDSKCPTETEELPSINERLSQLRPSRELLEYYRQKLTEYDNEYAELLKKLEKYKCAYEQVHKSQWEIQQREDEITELQHALSDMQVFLFQEREHVLRLYAENDRLKIRELEDRKRIQHLLSLTQPVTADVTYFHKEPPAKVLVEQHTRKKLQGKDNVADSHILGRGPGGHKAKMAATEDRVCEDDSCLDKESLMLTVEALKAQLEEQTKLCKEQVDSLLEDRRVRTEETESLHQKDTDKIKNLTDQLHMTQNLLYDSTKDYLELKYELRAKERSWMTDKDQLLQKLDRCHQLDLTSNTDPAIGTAFATTSPSMHSAKQTSIVNLQQQLEQTQQLADNYREQCIKMEEELSKLREESEASKHLFQQRTEKVSKRLGLMNARYEALEKRHALEIEGYKNDIKLLRQRLRELEKQLYKLTATLGGDKDVQILQQVKKTATNSKKLLGDLQQLKAKMYSLENDARHVHD